MGRTPGLAACWCSTALLAAGCLPTARPRAPLSFDPLSPAELEGTLLADAEGRAQDVLASGPSSFGGGGGGLPEGRRRAGAAPAGGQPQAESGIETIDGGQAQWGRGGPLEPLDAAPQDPGPGGDEGETLDATGVVPGQPTLPIHWPLAATGVTSLFGRRTDPISGGERFHYGLDLQGRYGELVRAIAPGRVVFAGWNSGHGRMVIVEHDGGWRSSYSHLAQELVQYDQEIDQSHPVGQLGNSGRSTGAHLHLEVTRWGDYYDPLDVLGKVVPADWNVPER